MRFHGAMFALLLLVLGLASGPSTYPPEVQRLLWPELARFSTPDALTDSVFGRATRPRGRPKVVRWHLGTEDNVWESLTVEYDELGRLQGWLKSGQLMDPSGRSAERDDEGRIVVTRMDWSTTKAPSSGYHWSYGSHGCPVSAKMLVDGEWKELIRFEYEDGCVRRRVAWKKDPPAPGSSVGIGSWKVEAEYLHDAEGRLVQIIGKVHGGTVRFDYDGLVVRRITSSVDGRTVQTVDLEHDDAGRLRLERETRLSDGPRRGIETRVWSETGSLVLERFCKGVVEQEPGEELAQRPCTTPGSTESHYADGDLRYTAWIQPSGVEHAVEYDLTFDEHGNWIRSASIRRLPDEDFIWREIEYYE